MKLRGLTCAGIPGVADGTFEFAKPNGAPHDLVLVTGDEATGKSRLLGVIAAARDMIAPLGEEVNQDAWVRYGQVASKVLMQFYLSDDEQEEIGAEQRVLTAEVIFRADPDMTAPDQTDPGLVYLLERYAHEDAVGTFELFAEGRRLDVGGGEALLDPETQKEHRTSASPRKFAFLPAFLASLRVNAEQADRFAATLARFGTTCIYDQAAHGLVSRGRLAPSLEALSSSETDAVLMSATATLVRLSNSVVLVDRPELYRADDASRALEGLRGLGDDNQLILATTAPDLLEIDGERVVIRLDERAPMSRAPRSVR